MKELDWAEESITFMQFKCLYRNCVFNEFLKLHQIRWKMKWEISHLIRIWPFVLFDRIIHISGKIIGVASNSIYLDDECKNMYLAKANFFSPNSFNSKNKIKREMMRFLKCVAIISVIDTSKPRKKEHGYSASGRIIYFDDKFRRINFIAHGNKQTKNAEETGHLSIK